MFSGGNWKKMEHFEPLYDYKVLLKMCWLPKQKQVESSNTKISQINKLKAPFIKVEDRSRRYRPEFLEMKSVPVIDFNVPLPQSPFETWYKKNVWTHRKKVSLIAKTCELCFGTYTDLDTHWMSVRHTSAAKDDSLFAGIDSLIARGTTLKQFKENMEQRKNFHNWKTDADIKITYHIKYFDLIAVHCI